LVGKNGKFDFACGKRTSFDRKTSGSAAKHTVFHNLKNLLSELIADIGPINHLKLARPNVICAYMPSVTKIKLEQIVVSEKVPFSITPQILSSALQKHDKDLPSPDALGYSDRRVVAVSANGYVVDSYLDKQVTDMHLTVFESSVETQVRKSALKAIYSRLSDVSIEETTFSVHLLSYLKRAFAGKSGLVACLSPDSTMTVGFKDGAIYHVEALDYGEHDLIKSIGKELSSLSVVTRSYIDLLSQAKLHGRQETSVQTAVQKVAKDYCDTISTRFLESAGGRIMSGGVYLLPTSRMSEIVFDLLIKSGIKETSPALSHSIRLMNLDDSELARSEKEGLYGSALGSIEISDLIV
jgi:hypothetical protein